MISPDHRKSASVVNRLRIEALINGVPKTEISRKLGLSRNTINKRLNGDDMRLSDFFDIAESIQADPVEIITSAIKKDK